MQQSCASVSLMISAADKNLYMSRKWSTDKSQQQSSCKRGKSGYQSSLPQAAVVTDEELKHLPVVTHQNSEGRVQQVGIRK